MGEGWLGVGVCFERFRAVVVPGGSCNYKSSSTNVINLA